MGNNNNRDCLEELVENLEKLPNNTIKKVDKDKIINNITKIYNYCSTTFEEYKNKRQIIYDNSIINRYLNRINKININNFNNNYLLYINSCKSLLNSIKSHNQHLFNQKSNDFNFNQNNNINFQNNSSMGNGSNMAMKTVQKEKVVQVQDLKLVNDNHGRALAALECYANRFTNNPTKYFDFYNLNNLANNKTNEQLRGQCIVQVQLFRMTYLDYTQKYGSYKTDNLSNENMINILNDWKKKVNQEDKTIYDEMIEILSNNNISSSSKSFNIYAKNCQNVSIDPKEIASMAPGISNYNHQRAKQAKKKYLETGEIESKLNIGQTYNDDKDAIELEKNIKSNKDYYENEYGREDNLC